MEENLEIKEHMITPVRDTEENPWYKPAIKSEVNFVINNNGWISIHDRLPEEYEQVLLVAEVRNSFIYSKTDRVITIGRLKPSCKWQVIGMEYLDMEVTHWQTLPALPKGE